LNITIDFFGTFKNYGSHIELALPDNCLVNDIKKKLFEKLKDSESDTVALEKLISISRLATNKAILDDNQSYNNLSHLAILPPVSGGTS